jgi:succinate-semialdehyde dehydrogenase/glutarate-semialdehyde dehydrogenase
MAAVSAEPGQGETKAQSGAGVGQEMIQSVDPMTLEVLGEVPVRDAAWVEGAVARARAAQPAWWKLGVKGRNRILSRARQIIVDEVDRVAEVVAKECGKTFTGAVLSDVNPSADWIAWVTANAKRFLEKERLGLRHYALMGRSSYLVSEPIGVVGVISPWNFPLLLSMQSVVSGLAAGNAVILKPSEITPLTGEMVAEIFHRAGVPQDVLIVASGDGRTGAAVVDHVDKVFFIGSSRTGRKIYAEAAKRMVPCVLELGGNAPALVLSDADLEKTARGLAWGAFFNAGQVCASVQRIYVARPLFDRFQERFVEETRKLRLSDDRAQADVGSLTCQMQLDIVEGMVKKAREEGATVLTGGKRVEGLKGLFYEPTVLADVKQQHEFAQEEVFGPVVMLAAFDTEDEAIRLANDTRYGLHASVWSRDVKRATRVAEQIHAGAVSVNDHVTMAGIPDAPWGGVKESGVGSIGSKYGFYEFLRRQHIHVNRFAGIPMPWWYPETGDTREGVKALGRALAGSGLGQRAKAALKALKHLKNG